MSFDASWFDELRGLSEEKLRLTCIRGIDGFVPHVGELCQYGYLSSRFVEETEKFVSMMKTTPYKFAPFFRAYEQHIVDFPKGRAFRKQWNIGFSAGDDPGEDCVRIGIGFRLSPSDSEYTTGIEEYLEFREQARLRPAVFDELFRGLGNYCEIDGTLPLANSESTTAGGAMSKILIEDQPELECWRFFGKRLMVRDTSDQAVTSSHERLRDVVVDVCGRIQHAGFGM